MEPRYFLAHIRWRLRWVLSLDALARLFCVFFGLAAVVALLDYAAPLPLFLRVLICLALFTLGLGLLYRRAWSPLSHSLDDAVLARVVERRLPQLNGLLFTSLEGHVLAGQQLREELQPQAAAQIVSSKGLRYRAGMAAGLLLALGLLAWLAPQSFDIAWRRVLLPWGAAEWPPAAALQVQLERNVVAEDEPLVLHIQRLYGPESVLHLAWENSAGIRDQRTLGTLQGPWRETLLLPPDHYQIAIENRDAATQILDMRVVRRPEVQLERVLLRHPDYSQRPDQELHSLDGAGVLPGSQLTIAMRILSDPHRHRQEMQLRWQGEAIPYEQEGSSIRADIQVQKAGTIEVDVFDVHRGLREGITQDIVIAGRPQARFAIATISDQAPQVDLQGPQQREAVSSQAEVAVQVQARDDIGLASLALYAYRQSDPEAEDDQPDQRQRIHSFADVAGARSTQRQYRIALANWASLGDELAIYAEAQDANDVSGPGIGRSPKRILRIVSVEDLRADLDQQLNEVRDRLMQARDVLARGLAEPAQLLDAARGASSTARRASEQLADVQRRWQDNRLDPERQEVLQRSATVLTSQALPALSAAGARTEEQPLEQARSADTALSQAIEQISSILRADDLLRLLQSLIRRQEALNRESRALVLASITAALNAEQQAQQQHILQRQEGIAGQLRDIERQILSGSFADNIRSLVQGAQAADRLNRAHAALAQERPQQEGLRQQTLALNAMQELLGALLGGADLGQIAREIGQLAAEQEGIEARLGDPMDPRDLAPQQADLQRRSAAVRERLAESQEEDHPAMTALRGALAAQLDAQQAMQEGAGSSARREAGSAAAQLRAAQRALAREEQAQDEDDSEQSQEPDFFTLLQDLIERQTRIVSQARVLDQELAAEDRAAGGSGSYQELNFAARRRIGGLASEQDDVRLLLSEEGLPQVEEHPIAQRAVQRVMDAVIAAQEHLAQPALGPRGLRLTSIALARMQELMAIAQGMPQPDPDASEEGGGAEASGEGAESPSFPPQAELALLRAEQQRLAWATQTRQPLPLAEEQGLLRGLVGFILAHSRSGSRAHLLLDRTQRAMASAEEALQRGEYGVLTQNEQDLALALLTQLLLEAAEQQSAQSSGAQQQAQASAEGASEGQSQSEADGRGGSAAAQQEGEPDPDQAAAGIQAGRSIPEDGRFLHHAPALRQRLIEALDDESLPAQARATLMRYFELLEEAGPSR